MACGLPLKTFACFLIPWSIYRTTIVIGSRPEKIALLQQVLIKISIPKNIL
jgi:hypothetical protein